MTYSPTQLRKDAQWLAAPHLDSAMENIIHTATMISMILCKNVSHASTTHLQSEPFQREDWIILAASPNIWVRGRTLDWPRAKEAAQQVRSDGVEQLISLWKKTKDRDNDPLLWGDETEGMLLVVDDKQRQVRPYLRAVNIVNQLNSEEEYLDPDGSADRTGEFQPEGGSFNLESMPGKPWGASSRDLLDVEVNMKSRRTLIENHMSPSGCFITLAGFPRLGARKDSSCDDAPTSCDEVQRSQFLSDDMVSPHVRYQTLHSNIRSRRGRKVEINVPVYRDKNTPWPFHDPTVNYDLHRWPEDNDVRNGAVKDNHIHMDSTLFGLSCCCLQVTVQARNMNEARQLYDQLLPMGPILLALTAATPMAKGFLTDTDVRWNTLAASTDDRTREESGDKPLSTDRWRIPKPRLASGSTYISQDPRLRDEYLDPNLIVDEAVRERLLDAGMDHRLATHFAHLLIRDSLIVYDDDLEEVNLEETRRFDMILGTNWHTLRLKPPVPSAKGPGWRVEVRPMEVQLTDFENAAFSIFVVLLSRTILHFNLNLYVPIPKIDENMQTAHTRDAVVSRSFFFRRNIISKTVYSELLSGSPCTYNGDPQNAPSSTNNSMTADEYRLMSINEIMNGGSSSSTSHDNPPGLIPLIRKYLDTCDHDPTTRSRLDLYLDLIAERASGHIPTTAKWLRSYVQAHPEYESNSVVGEGVLYDLVKQIREVNETRFSHGWTGKMPSEQTRHVGVAKV